MALTLRFIAVLGSLLLVVVGGLYVYLFLGDADEPQVIDFTSCAARFPVMESYPRQCRTPDGAHYVEEVAENAGVRDQTMYVDPLGGFSFAYREGEAGYVAVPRAPSSTDAWLYRVFVVPIAIFEQFETLADVEASPTFVRITAYAQTEEPLSYWALRLRGERTTLTVGPEVTELSGVSAVRLSSGTDEVSEALIAFHQGTVVEILGVFDEDANGMYQDFVELLGAWQWQRAVSVDTDEDSATSTEGAAAARTVPEGAVPDDETPAPAVP